MFLTLVGVLGSALGWIIRSTPGALVALFVALVALPDVFSYFGGWGKTVAKYSPLSAGQSFITSIHASDALAPWLGFLVLVLWMVVALTIAVILLLHRDA